MNIKEIHFYADVSYIYTKETIRSLYVSYEATDEAIKRDESVIHTTSIANLDFSLQDYFGYDIYMHDKKHPEGYLITYDMRQYLVDCTTRQLRNVHNIEKMWRAGEFDNDEEYGSPNLVIGEYVYCYRPNKPDSDREGWIQAVIPEDSRVKITGSWGPEEFYLGEDVIKREEWSCC